MRASSRLSARQLFIFLLLFSSSITLAQDTIADSPLSLCPQNPHYILFRDKPTLLIGSTEHYGAVLNSEFDYSRYLQTVQKSGLNLTRTFSGAYVEPDGAFNISHNTLAPATGKFLAPWARSDTPGYANGGNKFDLGKWDQAYFRRLRDFVSQASHRGIVVEIVLFCPYYEEPQWNLSPLNAKNNINGVGDIPRTAANTLKNGKLLVVQEAMVAKFASELKDFDNIYYEICNEPYFGGVTVEWQYHIAAVLSDAEAQFPHRHLIAQNISNGSEKIDEPNKLVSIFNFHYATPPNAVTTNYALNKPIADDETGFKGTGDAIYRMEAWDFFMAGGGIFDHLDYSYTAGHEDGSFGPLPPKQPGGGSPALREQLRILKKFLSDCDFVHMKPDNSIITSPLPKGVTVRALVSEAGEYAIYIRGKGLDSIEIKMPKGIYLAQWINTLNGAATNVQGLSDGRKVSLSVPKYEEDATLRIASP
jgi:hypothetical protein